MKKIVGIGNALVDVMTILKDDNVIHNLGFPKGSMTLVDGDKSNKIKNSTSHLVANMASGGSVANTIHGIAKLGVEAAYIGAIGLDDTGKVFKKDMDEVGVKSHLNYKNIDTGTAVAMISTDSERTFATHLGAAALLEANDIEDDMFKGYSWLYVEGYLITNYHLVDEVCRRAKRQGLKIALDLSSFNVVDAFLDKFRIIIENYVDLLFANEDEARSFTGLDVLEEALECLAESCEIAVLKTGKEGSLIRRGEEKIKVDSFDVRSIDTTGAGDLYASGFFYGLLNDKSLDICGKYATLMAANVIQVLGPKMDQEQWESIKAEIEKINNIQKG